jgi:hypothetical protein
MIERAQALSKVPLILTSITKSCSVGGDFTFVIKYEPTGNSGWV